MNNVQASSKCTVSVNTVTLSVNTVCCC